MQIEQALRRYTTQLRANGRSVHTVLQAQRHLRLLARWLAQEKRSVDLVDIDEDALASFLVSDLARTTERGASKSPGTMNSLRSSLKSFFGAATRGEWVPHDPARFIKRAICGASPPRAITAQEEQQLRAALEAVGGHEAERDLVLIEFMLATGARLSSALGIDREDVDLDEGVVQLRRVKGGRVERVLLGPGIRGRLAEYLERRGPGPVFARRDGKRITARHAQRRIRQWREAAGISLAVTAHSFRHTFGQRLFDRTHDLLLVQAALHHRSIGSTLLYARASEEGLRAALAQ